MQAIRAKSFTDNVVELMALKLHRLDPVVQQALRQLACMGHSAQTARLCLAYGGAESAIHEALLGAVVTGLVLRSANGYAFLHRPRARGRLCLDPEGERAAEHLRIGWILASQTPPEQLEENIFEIVNHLNRGAALIESQNERDRVAELNYIASRRAKASIATGAAQAYAALGRSLVGADGLGAQVPADLRAGAAAG